MAFILAPSSKISNLSFAPKGINSVGGEGSAQPRPRPKRATSSCPLETPFTIIVDTAEQLDYSFGNLHADAAQLHRPLVVRTIHRHLRLAPTRLSIDYSLEGYERVVGIERKSHEDFCNTLAGRHRRRFEQKLALINATFTDFAVIVEAEWSTILDFPPDFSAAVPRTLFRTYIAWRARYPKIHWLFIPGRVRAEQATFRVLERWWKELTAAKNSTKSPTALAAGCEGRVTMSGQATNGIDTTNERKKLSETLDSSESLNERNYL